MVKTEASHAFNIGSNPVRVTKSFRLAEKGLTSINGCGTIQKLSQRKRFDIEMGKPIEEVGIDCNEGPPVPIPNTEVKLIYADNTCRVTCREDR